MTIENLKKQHAELSELMEAAEKAGPFNAMIYAKKAAAKSFEIVGGLIERLEALEHNS